MKRCSACRESLPLTAFHRRGSGHQSVCKACRRAADAARHRDNPAHANERRKSRLRHLKAVSRALKDGPCMDCGGRFHPVAMQWDHRSTDKFMEISNMIKRGMSLERVEAEIQKCDLVCANCHAVRTHERQQRGVAQQ